jgi:amidase
VSELLFKPASELAALVREGEVTARELVEASLERIEALNGELNAFVLVDADGALAAADQVQAGDERPFAGVPVPLKDLVASAGHRFTFGSELFDDFTPQHDAFVVRRLREAGCIFVGRTNLPEFGILPVTEPRRHGPTRNPWDTDRTPGGSSGGAAAAVASGMAPVAHGSDGGGSIRIPAACCGLVGLKPARGRISRGPELGDDFLTTDGVLTRTVADTAELLDVMAGYEPGDSTWAPPPDVPFAEAARREPGRLRVGLTTQPAIECELDPVAERAAHEAGELLESLGHEVRRVDAPWAPFGDLLPVFTAVFGAQISMGARYGSMVSGREASPELVEPLSWQIMQRTRENDPTDYLGSKYQLQSVGRAVVGAWSELDVLLTPALGQRPVPIGQIDSCSDDPWDDFRRSGVFTPFTALFNVTGQPAISLPLFHGDDGLPLAVQLAGPPAGEATLLSLATQLEAARPWADRRPELAAA